MPRVLLAFALLAACSSSVEPPPVEDPESCIGLVCGRFPSGKSCGTCPDDGTCAPDRKSCLPAPPFGSACTAHAECGTGRICIEDRLVPGGYCSRHCSVEDPCPNGAACLPSASGESVCQTLCDEPASGTCRTDDGYACAEDQVCAPCVGSCDGRSCGGDGCGGPCGVRVEGQPACDTPGEVCASGSCGLGFDRIGSLTAAKWDMAVVEQNGLAVVIGGREIVHDPNGAGGTIAHSRGLAKVELFNPQSAEWTTPLQPLPEPIAHPHVAVLDGVIYVAGGTVDPDLRQDAESAALSFYKQDGIRWEKRVTAGLPAPSTGGALEALGGKLHLLAGETSTGLSDRTDLYDPVADRWTPGPARAVRRTLFASVSDGTRIWLIGGWDGEQALKTVEVFDPATGWSRAIDLQVGVTAPTAVVADGRIFVFGGREGPFGGPIPFVQVIDLATRRTVLDGSTWNSLSGQVPVRLRDGRVLLFGAREEVGGQPQPHDELLRFLVPAR